MLIIMIRTITKLKILKFTTIFVIYFLVVATTFGIILPVSFYKNKSQTQAFDYNFSNGWIDGMTGMLYDNFIIDSKAGLNNFATSVNAGFSFSGKTVSLLKDISLGVHGHPSSFTIGETDDGIHQFKGTFEGNNHIISDFTITSKLVPTTWNYAPSGFFAELGNGATIKNLVLENQVIYIPKIYYVEGALTIGGLAGFIDPSASVNINNCSVNSLDIRTTAGIDSRLDSQRFCGGLIGMCISGNVSISNCQVKKFNCYFKNDDFGNMSLYGGIVGCMNAGSISNCVHINTDSNISSLATSNYDEKNDILCSGQSYSIPSSCYSSKNSNFQALSKSSEGGKSLGTKYWYYDTQYSQWAELRNSMDWTEVDFVVNNSSYGSVDNPVLYIPTHSSIDLSLHNGSTAPQIAFYSQNVTAIPGDSGKFVSWTYNNRTYTANFEVKDFSVTISPIVGVSIKINNSEVTSSWSNSYTYGTTIYLISNSPTSVKYSIGSTVIEFIVNDVTKYISSYSPEVVLSQDVELTVTLSLKTYNIEFS